MQVQVIHFVSGQTLRAFKVETQATGCSGRQEAGIQIRSGDHVCLHTHTQPNSTHITVNFISVSVPIIMCQSDARLQVVT